MTDFSLFEVFQSLRPIKQIPPLWNVIYYEGIYGNHILFSNDEVLEFEKKEGPSVSESGWLENVGFEIFKLESVGEISKLLNQISKDQRMQVYCLYKQWLRSTTEFLRVHAN